MADKVLNTRIKLKIDTLANWATNNPVLYKGEIGFAVLESGDAASRYVGDRDNSTVLYKVGVWNGTDTASTENTTYIPWNSLNWGTAVAADVYAWAKRAVPTWSDFSAPVNGEDSNFVAGLKTLINNQDTNTSYQIVAGTGDNVGKIKLQAKEKGSNNWTDVGGNDPWIEVGVKDDYTIVKQVTAESGYASTYYLTKNNTQVGAKINIPLDMVVSNGTLATVATADTPYTGAVVGDKYIDLTIANASQTHIYIPVKDLVDTYTAGNGININSKVVSIKIDAQNSNGLEVTSSGLKLNLATVEESGAMSYDDKMRLDGLKIADGDSTQISFVGATGPVADISPLLDSRIGALDHADTAVNGQFVTEVDETDGVISVTRGKVYFDDLATDNNGVYVPRTTGNTLIIDCGTSQI